MTHENANLGEQALSKAAEIGITTQLDAVEQLDVDIQTDPLKMIQGEVDSVLIKAEGMVMQQDLRMEKMQVQTGKIALNPLSVAFGKIELTRPTEATAQVVLTEADLNRAFNSEYIGDKLKNLSVHLNGKPTIVDIQNVQLQLPGECQFIVHADIVLKETRETQQICFTATPRVKAGGTQVSLEDVHYAEGQDVSPEVTAALLDKASELLDLQNFELTGMTFRLQKLDVQSGKLLLQAAALVEQFPTA